MLNSHPVMVAPRCEGVHGVSRGERRGGPARGSSTSPLIRRWRASAWPRSSIHSCHLDIPYWSATPYLFGSGRAVKYIVRPRLEPPQPDAFATHRQLPQRGAPQTHLDAADATFDFLVQFQVDADRMPIEDATVEWKEEDSPYVAVASIRIPRQQIAAPETAACEQSAFDPWHCTGRASPARQLEPCAAGDLPGT